MHLRLFAVAMSLLCEVVRMGSGVMHKQSAHRETSEDCQSCLECSRDNGCVRCPERLFLFLQRKGMSHHGTCLHSCPAGHFGQRGRDVNRCMKCRSLDCEHCFNRDFCTKCKPGFKLHKGKCLIHCPEGTYAHQTDCLEDCSLAPLGEWSEWSVCVRDGATCGFRWGKQTRARESSQSGTEAEEKGASVCPPQSETQRCRMKKKCPTERRQNKKEDLEERGKGNDCDCSPAAGPASHPRRRQSPAEVPETHPADPPERVLVGRQQNSPTRIQPGRSQNE